MKQYTAEQAQELIGKYCRFLWTGGNNGDEGMDGWVWKVSEEPDGVWIVVDYGYGARLDTVEIEVVEPPENEYWDAESGTAKKNLSTEMQRMRGER